MLLRDKGMLFHNKGMLLHNKCPIWPQSSWYLLSEYINSTLATCAASAGMAIGRSGSRISFDTCESSNFTIFVPFAGFGIAGAVLLKIL